MAMSEPIRVTGCRVFLNLQEDEHLKGFASIILNDVFAVCDLKIILGNKGLFVAMPSRRRRDGTFHDVAHPICKNLRDHIEAIVLEEYKTHLAGEKSSVPAQNASV
jgi:stage V sporulation protein G